MNARISGLPATLLSGSGEELSEVLVRAPEIVAKTIRSAGLPPGTVREALADFDRIWDELFPAEQARLVRLLVERVDVSEDGIRVRLKTEGLRDVIRELQGPTSLEYAA